MIEFDCIERPLSIFFYKYGRIISVHPVLFILLPVFLTSGLSLGFLFRETILDATFLYTPTNARSRYERATIHEHWPLVDGHYRPGRAVTDLRQCQVIARSVDGGNILTSNFAKEVEKLNQFILRNVTVERHGNPITPSTNRSDVFGFEQLCLKGVDGKCFDNALVNITNLIYEKYPNDLTYPSFTFYMRHIYLASALGGVKPKKIQVAGGRSVSVVGSAQAWFLLYHLKFHPQNVSDISGLWEKEFQHQLSRYRSMYLKITYFHSQTLSEELKKNSDRLIPKFAITFCVLIAFAVLCSVRFIGRSYYIDWVLSKPTLAFLGVLNASLGVISAIGLLSLSGLFYNEIVSVMPFLVIAIGVDNMFLMIAAFRRTSRLLPVDKRISQSLSDSAISITITSLTDALSFGVGAITPIPSVKIFCIYTCLAIVFTFWYQLSFFAGFMVLYARLEEKSKHCIFLTDTKRPEKLKHMSTVDRLTRLGSRPERSLIESERAIANQFSVRFFSDYYAPTLMHPVIRGAVLIWLAVYLGFALYGCTLLREGLKPVNLLVSDSYAIPHYEALEEYFWKYGPEVQVMVNNAPNFSSPAGIRKAKAITQSYAGTRHTLGRDGIQFFLDDYENYLSAYNRTDEVKHDWSLFQSILYNKFLNTENGLNWREDITFRENPVTFKPEISAYRFVVGMVDFHTTNDQRETMLLMRKIASKFPERNITTFNFFFLFADQYLVILPNTLQNIGIALGFMLVISLLLIPQPVIAVWVALAIVSIDVGVVGYMTLWGVNLDAISMITIIMSIGFSVDFAAHISYGYVISSENTPIARVSQALGALGWPIFQGAISTVLGVVALATVEAYMIVTFFKTVFLVIVLGALHGLVFLPVLLSVFISPCCLTFDNSEPEEEAIENNVVASKAHKSTSHGHEHHSDNYSVTGRSVRSIRSRRARSIRNLRRTEDHGVEQSFADEEDEVQPYGPYGIYLPRLFHSYYPGPADHSQNVEWHNTPGVDGSGNQPSGPYIVSANVSSVPPRPQCLESQSENRIGTRTKAKNSCSDVLSPTKSDLTRYSNRRDDTVDGLRFNLQKPQRTPDIDNSRIYRVKPFS